MYGRCWSQREREKQRDKERERVIVKLYTFIVLYP